MSGHSKWATIKRKKGAKDAARGKMFSKLIKEITIAARHGGGDINGNARLRTAVDAAKAENMPSDNITRAIKRGTGELAGGELEEITYEGYAPHGVAVLIQCLTDNRNRTLADVRRVFNKHGGNLAEPGAVGWMFDQKGYITVTPGSMDADEIFMVAVDAGADDIMRTMDAVGLDIAQLHGHESPEFCRQLSASGRTVIKAVGLDDDGRVNFAAFDQRSECALQ